jgi:hypothetical protein
MTRRDLWPILYTCKPRPWEPRSAPVVECSDCLSARRTGGAWAIWQTPLTLDDPRVPVACPCCGVALRTAVTA